MAVPPVDGKFPRGNLHQTKKTSLPCTYSEQERQGATNAHQMK